MSKPVRVVILGKSRILTGKPRDELERYLNSAEIQLLHFKQQIRGYSDFRKQLCAGQLQTLENNIVKIKTELKAYSQQFEPQSA